MTADRNPSRCTHPLHGTGTVCAYCGANVQWDPERPSSARSQDDDAETLAHLDMLNRRRFRLANQLVVARERLEDLEREVRRANDDFNLAQAQYQRDAARPLVES